jgi:quercetin dioxygenase-like cupin family protein
MNRVFNCTGIPILRLGRWRAELWLVPAGCEIPDHRHRHLDAWLCPLWGFMTWRRGGRTRNVGPIGPISPMPVPRGVVHGASAHTRSAFLTLEHWLPGVRVTSAAHDLQIA